MKRNIIFSLMGVILSIGLALGGWQFTGILLRRQEQNLLSGQAQIRLAAADTAGSEIMVKEEVLTNEPEDYPDLTAAEILPIITNWQSNKVEYPRYPNDWQLNLEEAIGTGEKCLAMLSEQMGIPDVPWPYDNVKAYLANKDNEGTVSLERWSYYCYWRVGFVSESGTAEMMINAVTGDVWDIRLSSRRETDFSPWCTPHTLDEYLELLALEADTKYEIADTKSNYPYFISPNAAYCTVGDGSLLISAVSSASMITESPSEGNYQETSTETEIEVISFLEINLTANKAAIDMLTESETGEIIVEETYH